MLTPFWKLIKLLLLIVFWPITLLWLFVKGIVFVVAAAAFAFLFGWLFD